MADRCPTDVKYEFHGMDMDIYMDFSPSEENKMTEYEKGVQHGIIVGRRSVEPKHGRWIWKGHYLVCSECGKENDRKNYCPNCGSKMDESTMGQLKQEGGVNDG